MFYPADLLHLFGGIAHGTLLQRYGCTRKELAKAAKSGAIARLRPGLFALATTDPQVVTAAMHGGALTCAAALRSLGIWVLPHPDDEVHVWMGSAGRVHPHADCRCIVHYSSGRAEVGLAPIAAALVHAFRCLTREAFFAAYESAWNKRLISAPDRARIRAALPQAVGWMLDLARSDAESGLESLLRLRLHLLGIRLDCQVVIDGVGRVDFVVGGRLILEVDGKGNHANELRHKDLIRDARASALGYETLRFDYAMVLYEWDLVVEAILPALGRARG